jgi:hypothetical protein
MLLGVAGVGAPTCQEEALHSDRQTQEAAGGVGQLSLGLIRMQGQQTQAASCIPDAVARGECYANRLGVSAPPSVCIGSCKNSKQCI